MMTPVDLSRSNVMNDDIEILWNLYKDNIEQGRLHEGFRATMLQINLALAAAVITLISSDKIVFVRWPLSVFLIGLGIFGALFSAKQYERFELHMNRARAYRGELEARLTPPVGIGKLKSTADAATQSKHSFLFGRRLHSFWLGAHLLVLLLGLILLATSGVAVSQSPNASASQPTTSSQSSSH
jgi:hypothetical protein